MPELSILHAARGNAVGIVGTSLVIFGRTRALDAAALDAMEVAARRFGVARTGAVGAIAVVHGDAGLSDNALLDRQRTFLRSFLRPDGDVYFAMAVLGDSAQSIAMRAVVRLFTIGRRTMHLVSSVDEAARWIGGRVALEPKAIEAAVHELLARAEASAAPRASR